MLHYVHSGDTSRRQATHMNRLTLLLKEEMDKRGWSLRDLAAKAEIAPSAVSKLMTDKEREPRLSTLAALAAALEIPLRRVVEAAGFPVEVGTADAQLTALAAAVPGLEPFLAHLGDLTPDDRAAVLAMAEALSRRQAQKAK